MRRINAVVIIAKLLRLTIVRIFGCLIIREKRRFSLRENSLDGIQARLVCPYQQCFAPINQFLFLVLKLIPEMFPLAGHLFQDNLYLLAACGDSISRLGNS